MCFDLTGASDQTDINAWISELDRYKLSKVPKVFVATKNDADTVTEAQRERARRVAGELGFIEANAFFLTSAKTGDGAEAPFERLVQMVLENPVARERAYVLLKSTPS